MKAKYFHTMCSSKKLFNKNLGMFKIIMHPGTLSCMLRLPDSMKSVHPVFHVSLLEISTPNTIPNCTLTLPPSIKVDEKLSMRLQRSLTPKLIDDVNNANSSTWSARQVTKGPKKKPRGYSQWNWAMLVNSLKYITCAV